jgi:hypothetical protein
VFQGITDRLIPLFAVGAFGAFTASQAGMVLHWRRALRANPPDRHKIRTYLVFNAVGAATTAAALIVIMIAKFVEGAWVTLLAIPSTFVLFRLVKRHYLRVARQLRRHTPLELDTPGPPVILVPTDGWNKVTEKSIDLALRLSPDVTAVHLAALNPDEPTDQKLREQWKMDVEEPARRIGLPPPRLEIVHSPFRKFLDPLLEHVERMKQAHPRRQIAVMVPEVVKRHWWQFLLHQYRAERLRRALLKRGDRQMVLINVPWYLDD